jgi:hypothetical protein
MQVESQKKRGGVEDIRQKILEDKMIKYFTNLILKNLTNPTITANPK